MKTSAWCSLMVTMLVAATEATTSTPCSSENHVRLVFVAEGISSEFEVPINFLAGVLEICSSGLYQGICDTTFSTDDANAYCRSLGYIGGDLNYSLPFTYTGSLVPDGFNCTGNEMNLTSCPEVGGEACVAPTSVVEIACFSTYPVYQNSEDCFHGRIRGSHSIFPLVPTVGPSGEPALTFYTVPQFCVNGMSGGICNRVNNPSTASVICRTINPASLDGTFAQLISATDLGFSGQVEVQDMECGLVDVAPLSCQNNFNVDSTCSGPSNAAVVECSYAINYGFCDTIPIIPTNLDVFILEEENVVALTALPIVCTTNETYGSICRDGITTDEVIAICRNIGSIYQLFNLTGVDDTVAIYPYNGPTLVSGLSCDPGSFYQDCDSDETPSCSNNNYLQVRCIFERSPDFIDPRFQPPGQGSGGFGSGGFGSGGFGSGGFGSGGFGSGGFGSGGFGSGGFGSGGFGSGGFGSGSPGTCSEGSIFAGSVEHYPGLLIGPNGAPEMAQKIRPEVCVGGRLGGICDRGFDDAAARVACSQVNSYPIEQTRGQVDTIDTPYSGPIYVQDVNCSDATSIQDCSFNIQIDSECSNPSRAVAIMCAHEYPCIPGVVPTQLQYVPPSSPNGIHNFTFLPLVCDNNGSFGSICSEGFTADSARVACGEIGRVLGLTILDGEVDGLSDSYSGTPIVQDVACTGLEYHLGMCPNSTIRTPQCTSSSGSVELRCYFDPFASGSGSIPGMSGDGMSGDGSSPVPGLVLPAGIEFGDSVLVLGETTVVQLSTPFIFYGQAMSQLYILENGLITFSPCDRCNDVTEFSTEFVPLIAPFWHDTALFLGNVYYRIATDMVTLQGSSDYILAELGDVINPSLVVVVTWDGVPGSIANSTFQALLATDGVRSYILFAYEEIQVSGRFSAGYSVGDGTSFRYVISLFASPDNLVSQSNVRNDTSPGRYIFRVDNLQRIAQAPLLPYGPSEGDLTLPRSNSTVASVTLGVPFFVNTTRYSQAYIYTDGYITLGDQISSRPFVFPLPSTPIISPFTQDFTTVTTGNIYYRKDNDPTLLSNIATSIGIEQPNSVEEVLIVTWEDVPIEFAQFITTTFQAVLISTRDSSYALFLYGNGSHPDGSLIGINFGDGVSHITEDNTAGIEFRGNVPNAAGVFLYQVSSDSDEPSTDSATMIPFTVGTAPPSEGCNVERELRGAGRGSETFDVVNNVGQYQYTLQRIEVCYNSLFRPVCSSYISDIDVSVICREVTGFHSIIGEVSSDFSTVYAGMTLDTDVECTGGEQTVTECSVNQLSSPNCANPTIAATVRCATSTALTFGTGPSDIQIIDRIADFGLASGDFNLLDGSNQVSPAITLDPPLPFLGEMESRAYVHTNGLITFRMACVQCNLYNFPSSTLPPSIAVLWQTFATTADQGNVFYRVTSHPQLMFQVYSFILQATNVVFNPSYALIATWDGVQETSASTSSPTNTFQTIIATDGTSTYVTLFYREVNLTRDAQVGFNLGDGEIYYSVASFQDGLSSSIQNGSNVQSFSRPGLYLYRVDNIMVSTSPPPAETSTNANAGTDGENAGTDGEPALLVTDASSTLHKSYLWLAVSAIALLCLMISVE